MSRLPLPIRDQLRERSPSPEAVDRLLQATRERMAGARQRRRAALVLAPTLALATLAAVVYLRPHASVPGPGPGDDGALRLASGEALGPLTTGAAPRTVALSDGARLQLDPDSTIEPLLNDRAGIELALRHGRVRVVTPSGSRRFTIGIAAYQVQVAGAEFSAWRTDVEVGVTVWMGEAVVSGVGEARKLGARETFRERIGSAALPSSAVVPNAEPPLRSPAGPREVATAAPPASPPGDWRTLAAERRMDRAWEALGRAGVREATRSVTTVDDLLQLADVARLSGHPAEALPVLVRVEKEFAADPRASIAAFTRGRVLVDELHRPAEAADAFAAALALGLPEALSESAAYRLVTAREAAGDHAGALEAAAHYRERYPSGRFADQINEITRRP